MKKFTILIPIYNDWESLEKLLNKINESIENITDAQFDCVIINDCSKIKNPKLKIPDKINSIRIIHMSKNEGHARCNAFGIKYLSDSPDLDYLILMDGDGEDRPEEIKLLVNKILNEPNKSVVAKRIKRSEGFLFQMLYRLHKYLTLLTTGKLIDFGNYSCLIKSDIKKLSTKSSLWSSYSGTFKKNIKNYNEINSFRGMRYFGPSQMSLFKLLVHSLSIIAVFKYRVFFSSLLFLILLYCLEILIQYNFLFLQALIMLFNIFVFVVSFRESEKELESSQLNIASVEKITH
jgi:glycosyltransferase involved in cell wall biosynthesis|tara:strand:+ start:3638 stop:4510 length:873 start_codon:yes stop_codon:yes gene_type:complete